tara:strand:- start:20195 stop:20947 length:753 start_codon:yes stop_codon:yes gene_type:complete
MKIGSLFSGIGGFELGLEQSIDGAETIWQVEQDPFCQKVLQKHWPNATIYNDVTTVGKHNLEPVDLLCGGFPCQDLSVAGSGKGINEGEKSSLWWEMYRIIGDLRPRYVVCENVPVLRIRGLDEVCGSLAKIGYDAEWQIISCKDQGGPHRRDRIFIVAYANGKLGKKQSWNTKSMGSVQSSYNSSRANGRNARKYWERHPPPPPFCRVDDGVPNRMDRIKALGNAVVPQVSAVVGKYVNKHWKANHHHQ